MNIEDFRKLPDLLVMHRHNPHEESANHKNREAVETVPTYLFSVSFTPDNDLDTPLTQEAVDCLNLCCTAIELTQILDVPRATMRFVETVKMATIKAILAVAAQPCVSADISLHSSKGELLHKFHCLLKLTGVATKLDAAVTQPLTWDVSFALAFAAEYTKTGLARPVVCFGRRRRW